MLGPASHRVLAGYGILEARYEARRASAVLFPGRCFKVACRCSPYGHVLECRYLLGYTVASEHDGSSATTCPRSPERCHPAGRRARKGRRSRLAWTSRSRLSTDTVVPKEEIDERLAAVVADRACARSRPARRGGGWACRRSRSLGRARGRLRSGGRLDRRAKVPLDPSASLGMRCTGSCAAKPTRQRQPGLGPAEGGDVSAVA